jgi:glucose-6-phosphate 1-dehydrogenase
LAVRGTVDPMSTAAPALIVLGASGDMARRLLFPALYELEVRGRLPAGPIVGYALEDWDDDRFRDAVRAGIAAQVPAVQDAAWRSLSGRMQYLSGQLDAAGLGRLGAKIDGAAIFYLALPPGLFAQAATALADAGLHDGGGAARRLVIEKPFGHDRASAEALNAQLHARWREDQIFRIDHFLGKETVQNLLVFRFSNRFLEPVLNSHHIAQVQITVAETLGLEGRYRYYDGIGCLRDMLQNHLMQLFTLTAIEPPSLYDADVLRDHKVEVLKSVRPFTAAALDGSAARGVYTAGHIGSEAVPGYREEPGIPAGSSTETFAALKFHVDNWRWTGVPFYLRSGKRLAAGLSEIAIQFREPPTRLFQRTAIEQVDPNWLVFRLKPHESIDLIAQAKVPGLALEAHDVTLHADYRREDDRDSAAYEQLILDVIEDDHTSFLRFDEVEEAWRLLDPILQAWGDGQPEPYAAGSRGPDGQDRLLEPGHAWRPIAEPSAPSP